jgi:acyl carrier protein
MDSKEILSKLVTDVSKIGSVPKEAVDPKAALVTILDSLSISQFKGLLEAEYAVKISDEYLFREKTNLNKLVEVVKLGYAPDDGDENAPVAAAPPSSVGTRGGLAGALGCPPGVCCVVM